MGNERVPMTKIARDSVFQRNIRLASFIKNGEVGAGVLDDLLPGGLAHADEKSMWDYKLELPVLPQVGSPPMWKKQTMPYK